MTAQTRSANVRFVDHTQYLSRIGRVGGRSTSAAKLQAVRKNLEAANKARSLKAKKQPQELAQSER